MRCRHSQPPRRRHGSSTPWYCTHTAPTELLLPLLHCPQTSPKPQHTCLLLRITPAKPNCLIPGIGKWGLPKDTGLWRGGEGAHGNGSPEPTAGQSQLGPSRGPHRSRSPPAAAGRFPRMELSCSLGQRKGVFPDTAQGIRLGRRQFLARSWPGITGLCPDLQGSRLS